MLKRLPAGGGSSPKPKFKKQWNLGYAILAGFVPGILSIVRAWPSTNVDLTWFEMGAFLSGLFLTPIFVLIVWVRNRRAREENKRNGFDPDQEAKDRDDSIRQML